jgi:hypothetical protein
MGACGSKKGGDVIVHTEVVPEPKSPTERKPLNKRELTSDQLQARETAAQKRRAEADKKKSVTSKAGSKATSKPWSKKTAADKKKAEKAEVAPAKPKDAAMAAIREAFAAMEVAKAAAAAADSEMAGEAAAAKAKASPTATLLAAMAALDVDQQVYAAKPKQDAAGAMFSALGAMDDVLILQKEPPKFKPSPIDDEAADRAVLAMERGSFAGVTTAGDDEAGALARAPQLTASDLLSGAVASMELAMIMNSFCETEEDEKRVGEMVAQSVAANAASTTKLLQAVASMEAGSQGGGRATSQLLQAVASMESTPAKRAGGVAAEEEMLVPATAPTRKRQATESVMKAVSAMEAEHALEKLDTTAAAADAQVDPTFARRARGGQGPTEEILKAVKAMEAAKRAAAAYTASMQRQRRATTAAMDAVAAMEAAMAATETGGGGAEDPEMEAYLDGSVAVRSNPTATLLAAMAAMEEEGRGADARGGEVKHAATEALMSALSNMNAAKAGTKAPADPKAAKKPSAADDEAVERAVARLERHSFSGVTTADDGADAMRDGGRLPPGSSHLTATELVHGSVQLMELAMIMNSLEEASAEEKELQDAQHAAVSVAPTASLLHAIASMEADAQGGGAATKNLLQSVATMEATTNKGAGARTAPPPAASGGRKRQATEGVLQAVAAMEAERALETKSAQRDAERNIKLRAAIKKVTHVNMLSKAFGSKRGGFAAPTRVSATDALMLAMQAFEAPATAVLQRVFETTGQHGVIEDDGAVCTGIGHGSHLVSTGMWTALCTEPLARGSGLQMVEFELSKLKGLGGVSPASVGMIAPSSGSLDKVVGFQMQSVGYFLNNGDLYVEGENCESHQTVMKSGDRVRLEVATDTEEELVMQIWLNGALKSQATVQEGWCFAAGGTRNDFTVRLIPLGDNPLSLNDLPAE